MQLEIMEHSIAKQTT